MKSYSILFIIFLSFFACEKIENPNVPHEKPEIPEEKPHDFLNDPSLHLSGNVLFIGNSLTSFNDLPQLFKNYSMLRGNDIRTAMHALPYTSLQDLWYAGIIQNFIASGKFAFVVVQQGPSSQEEGRGILLEYGAKLKALCDEYGAKLAFFMVWPDREYYHTFDGVIRNYTDAAYVNHSILCPVGKVWKEHFDAHNDFSYYGGDGFHPSLKGSEVAAKVIHHSLYP
ncbi:MAG TPA: hypothetical protein PKC30_02595 [Saprospiraceae bacterium]|nr:hypothetical protein [Saprospiraceae bacterium]